MIEMERVRRACENRAFLERIYTAEECRQAGGSVARLAGNFAVKEAVAKALGTGFRGFGPKEIEVLRDEKGKPYVRVRGGAGQIARGLGICAIHVSITNLKEYASAFAVAEGDGILGGHAGRPDRAAGENAGGMLYEISGDRAADEGD